MRVIIALAIAMHAFALVCLVPAHANEGLSDADFNERHSGPAVSGINGKISLGYIGLEFNTNGTTAPKDFEDGVFGEGSLAVPIGERFGFQLDATYGHIGGGTDIHYYGVGGHLFWRDPERVLLGLYAHFKEYGDYLQTYQIAAEGELYVDRLNFELLAGLDVIDTAFGDDESFVGEAIVAYYPHDNLRLSAGVRHAFGNTAFVVGAEAMLQSGKLAPSLFADASFDRETVSVSGGVRLYFGGGNKSLIRRHREDDPKIRLHANSDMFGDCFRQAQSRLSGNATGSGSRFNFGQCQFDVANEQSGNAVNPMTTGSVKKDTAVDTKPDEGVAKPETKTAAKTETDEKPLEEKAPAPEVEIVAAPKIEPVIAKNNQMVPVRQDNQLKDPGFDGIELILKNGEPAQGINAAPVVIPLF